MLFAYYMRMRIRKNLKTVSTKSTRHCTLEGDTGGYGLYPCTPTITDFLCHKQGLTKKNPRIDLSWRLVKTSDERGEERNNAVNSGH